jgi:hypothetical protein
VFRSSIDPELAGLARRERTLVVAVTAVPDQTQRTILEACQRAGIPTRTIARSADAPTLLARSGTVDRILVFGGPVETTLLHVAMHLGALARTVGIIWDACEADSDLTFGLTRDRATQAGVIPYTLAAFIAELGLVLATTTLPRRYSEVA